jgi:hypothetical protein
MYSSPVKTIKSRKIRWTEHVAHMGKKRNGSRFCLGNLKYITFGRYRYEDNIKMSFKNIRLECMAWFHATEDKGRW